MSEEENVKKITMTVRMSESEYARFKRACSRDELKPSRFAYESIMAGVENLLAKQEIHGFQCMSPL